MANNRRRNKRRAQKRKIMRSLTINRMAAVDVPAQEGATALILKRADGLPDLASFTSMVDEGDFKPVQEILIADGGFDHVGQILTTTGGLVNWGDGTTTYKFVNAGSELIEKLILLTSSEDDHQHAVRLDRWDIEEMGGSTSYQGGEHDDHHNHDYVINTDGSITIGETMGHTHGVEMSILERLQTIFANKRAPKKGEPGYDDEDATDKGGTTTTLEKSDMDEEEVQALIDAALAKSKEESAAELALAKSFGELTDVQKSHYGNLDEGGQAGFLSMTPDQRQSAVDTAVQKANDADPVVYVAENGTEYHKSDDPRVIEMAKERDEDRKEINAMRQAAETTSLEKRAGELEFLPGTTEVKISMLKAIDAIPNEAERQSALESLQSQNSDMAKAFETHGVRNGTVTHGGPSETLEGLAKKYATDHKVDEDVAMVKVLETPEGEALYAQSVN